MSSAAGARRCLIDLALPSGEDNVQVGRSGPARTIHRQGRVRRRARTRAEAARSPA